MKGQCKARQGAGLLTRYPGVVGLVILKLGSFPARARAKLSELLRVPVSGGGACPVRLPTPQVCGHSDVASARASSVSLR